MDLLQFLIDKNNVFIVAVAVVSGIMLMLPALRKGRAGAAVGTSEAIQMVNQRQAVWVDVRPTEQFQAGHIAQARSLPAADLEKKAGALPKNKPLIVVCEQGRDAARIAARLRSQGFAEVSVLEGGMRAWFAAGLPVTQKG
ncbi:sulfurtransferase [Bordetella pertussis]|uniref:Rhodanese domain-containing protein n=8 Tax=Bordetella TaxID=517 RepID=Q7VS44_BORPE|nr:MULTISPECIES: rhodanese-like domain-containing protein [Bordetella]ETH44637.1 rhodanese-like protein [Bordetella pertussis H939]ETH72687.1 rhodanese-like protein [Bordetella pertussis STO1-CHLA-0011]ETH83714.1 rhodanese-like protein [Bordetella pertussis STO1-CHOC-0017]ETH86623.1 rhodanese-like protein [Bordetella pertussis STO1-CHOC-0018]ETH93295.1 rhodanese-like protein [Bordetella pertussis STO1-CHOC-0019]ETI00069.1 rhodanese-like protein [Bordetella pertussis STO1-CHOM-0012]KAK60025.1